MSNNRITSYILYAIGEIILVVIGILIAVNINNWNADRQQKRTQTKYLQNLKNDLEADWNNMDTTLRFAKRKILAARNIRERSNKDSVGSIYDFSANIYQLIFVTGFTPNQSTLEEMMSTGNFSNLQNDSLKQMLVELNRTYEFIEAGQEHIRNDYDVFLEIFEHYVDWGDYYDLKKTKNIAEMVYDSARIDSHQEEFTQNIRDLLHDKVFMNNIFLFDVNYGYFIPVYSSSKEEIQKIINLIEKEISNQWSSSFEK